jgi:hypothetical protein
MFSVDNFYTFFNSYYGWDSQKTVPWIFRPHGSKRLEESYPLLHGNVEFFINKALIMHDQENFSHEDSLYIYRQYLIENKKWSPSWQALQDGELFLAKFRSCSWPIFCHSEKNSDDIKWLENIGCIPCYYFWHGLISRDWFRHWKYHGSFQKPQVWKKRFLLYIRDCSGTRSYRMDIKKQLYKFKTQIDCDWDGTKNITSDFSAKISMDDAKDTAIHLVAETLFDQSKIHVTEKVFKPMVMKQPFILFATPGTLDYLKGYGFRTFDSVWDESYDNEKNPTIRMEKVVKLVTDLYQKTDSEFKDLMDQCQEIIDHNQQHFFSQSFENQLLDELHSNMQIALEIQHDRWLNDVGGSWFFVYDSMKKRNLKMPVLFEKDTHEVIAKIKNQYPERYQRLKEKYLWC